MHEIERCVHVQFCTDGLVLTFGRNFCHRNSLAKLTVPTLGFVYVSLCLFFSVSVHIPEAFDYVQYLF